MKYVVLGIAALLAGCGVAQSKLETTETTASPAVGLSHAEILYGYRCKGCHEPATPGAPDRKTLATFDESEIVDALRSGPMKKLATGLTKQEIRDLAAFLSDQRVAQRK